MNSSPANTLLLFQGGAQPVHPSAAWYFSDLGEFRGKQELYTRQSPQRLKVLREHALIESAVSSNRMEGVAVEPARIPHVLAAPRPLFRDRDEEEVDVVHCQGRGPGSRWRVRPKEEVMGPEKGQE